MLMKEHLVQMGKLLDELVKVTATGSTVAATKKVIPFHTGSQQAGQLLTPPANPDDYPTQINLYAQNDNKPIQHMTLINDGPGGIFYVVGYSQTDINTKEGHLNINDQRELFNVYHIRLRSTLPLTTFRLIEGIFRTGSTAPQTKINVEIRSAVQPNEVIKLFEIVCDNKVNITINQPTVQNFTADFSTPSLILPLPPGQTAAFVDVSTGLPMPFTIPEGFILESFGFFSNINTDYTIRGYFELDPINHPNIFTLTQVFPATDRGALLGPATAGNLSTFTSQFFDPLGAPPGGRKILSTITNDDPFNELIGSIFFASFLIRLT